MTSTDVGDARVGERGQHVVEEGHAPSGIIPFAPLAAAARCSAVERRVPCSLATHARAESAREDDRLCRACRRWRQPSSLDVPRIRAARAPRPTPLATNTDEPREELRHAAVEKLPVPNSAA